MAGVRHCDRSHTATKSKILTVGSLPFGLVDQKNDSVSSRNKAPELCMWEWEIWDFVSNTACLIALNRKRIGKTRVGDGAGRVGRHVSSRWVLSSYQTSHTFSLSMLSPPKRNSACCKCGQDFQNTYTLEPSNLNQSALPLLPNFINHSSEQLKAGHLLNGGPGAGG